MQMHRTKLPRAQPALIQFITVTSTLESLNPVEGGAIEGGTGIERGRRYRNSEKVKE